MLRRQYRDAHWIAQYANFKRDPKKHPQPFGAEDFLPRKQTIGVGPEVYHRLVEAIERGEA